MTPATLTASQPTILLVGHPNVGKSAIFNALTGSTAIVSNYPGTTVAVLRGRIQLGGQTFPLLDTPGAYSLMPVTDEERIARDSLFATRPVAVVHVVDAKNLDRALTTTLELLDAGLPLVLAINMSDEADRDGIRIDTEGLAKRLCIPVVRTVAVGGRGILELQDAIARVAKQAESPAQPPGQLWLDVFGPVVDRLAAALPADHSLPAALAPRIATAMILRGSRELAERSKLPIEMITAARRELQQQLAAMPPVAAILALRRRTEQLLAGVFERPSPAPTLRTRLGHWLAHPLLGLLPLLAVLYLGFYQLVGVFGAGTVVGFLEEDVFGKYINPLLERCCTAVIPWGWLQALFVGEYGIFTLGLTYALALVLPVVGAFFLVFSIVEDSGYFPRLALLCDRIFKRVGLNGRAVVTMVLGLGCATMATTTTRTLETRRERVLATLLLVLTIPCSAQLGLITGLLAAKGFSLWLIYVGALVTLFLVTGWAAAKVLPGRAATFHMELVPMRCPQLGNVMRKTWLRLVWYFKEVVPLFLWASVILWVLDQSGAMHYLQKLLEPPMALIGMPVTAAESFLVGFFRRDFGAAGLFSLAESGELEQRLTERQLLVGAFTLTLFVPCVATFMMMIKERGLRLALTMFVVVTTIALCAGATMNRVLLLLGWN